METSEASTTHDSGDQHPFAGMEAWLITDGVAGGIAQLRGVAAALGATETIKTITLRWPWSMLAPRGPVPPSMGFGRESSAFAPPWPTIAIATARRTIPYIRALKRAAGDKTFTVILQDPRMSARVADLICAPAHDRITGENVFKTLTSPSPYSIERIAALRKEEHRRIDALPGRKIAVIIGGPNAVYRYTPKVIARLAASLRALAKSDTSFLVTPSRRTTPDLKYAATEALSGAPRIVWNGEGENPYPHFLARADAFVVTADSVNMASEACVTGRPVYIFTPDGGSGKFSRFHSGLRDYGATRPLPEDGAIADWTYAPLDAAAEIAREIARRVGLRADALAVTPAKAGFLSG